MGFGDGFDTVPDPENAMAGYAMSQGGFLYRYNLETGESRMIRPAPHTPGLDLRFNWDAGFAQDPFDPATIYYGSQFLHRSADRGNSWSVISGDLTSNDPEFQTFRETGGLTPDVTTAENYTTIVAIAPSELERGVLWVGTDDGRVHVTRDGGANWNRVDRSARGAPAGAWVAMITPSPHDAGTAFVALDDHRRSDMAPYVYRVSDYGQRWKRLNPEGLSGYALSVLQDHVDPELLFVGTEFGLFVSIDGGAGWTRFTAGLPTVSVMDMAIQRRESDLVLGTHGRSVYVIDDYSGLRGIRAADFGQRLKILSATTGQHYDANPTASTRFTGSGEFRGENEPYGVSVTFLASGDDLPHPDADRERQRKMARRQPGTGAPGETGGDQEAIEIEMTVSDGAGGTMRTLRKPVHQGLNRITWDLRVDGVRLAPGVKPRLDGSDETRGPEVAPGNFRVTLKLGDAEDATEVNTVPDPRSEHSQADFEARFTAQMQLQALQERYVEALERIDRARSDIDAIAALITRHGDDGDETLEGLEQQAGQAREALDGLERTFRTPPDSKGIAYHGDKPSGRLQVARSYLDSTPGAPTQEAMAYVGLFRQLLNERIKALNNYLAGDLAKFRAAVNAAGIGLLNSAEPMPEPD